MDCLFDAATHLEARRRQLQVTLDDYIIVLEGLRRILAMEAPEDAQVVEKRARRPKILRKSGKSRGRGELKVTVARRDAILRHLEEGPQTPAALVAAIRPTRGLDARRHKNAIYQAIYQLKRTKQIRRDGTQLVRVAA